MKLIADSQNGQIFMCPRRKVVHVEYGNIFLMISFDEFNQMVEYVNSIDHQFYLEKNKKAQNKRKLLLNVGFKDMFLALNVTEFHEFKNMISLRKKKHCMLQTSEIINNVLQLN